MGPAEQGPRWQLLIGGPVKSATDYNHFNLYYSRASIIRTAWDRDGSEIRIVRMAFIWSFQTICQKSPSTRPPLKILQGVEPKKNNCFSRISRYLAVSRQK